MSQRLKSTIQWFAVIIAIIVVVFGVLVPLGVTMLKPTFFPGADISGFTSCIQQLSIVLSFASAGLSVVAIFQSSENNKETRQTLVTIKETVDGVRTSQDHLETVLRDHSFAYSRQSRGPRPPFAWVKDTIKN